MQQALTCCVQLQLQLQVGYVLHAGGARNLTRITHMDTTLPRWRVHLCSKLRDFRVQRRGG
jgi:hypothetical protein